MTGHTDAVNSIAVSPDGKSIVSGSHDLLLKIWNLETGAEVSCIMLWRSVSPAFDAISALEVV